MAHLYIIKSNQKVKANRVAIANRIIDYKGKDILKIKDTLGSKKIKLRGPYLCRLYEQIYTAKSILLQTLYYYQEGRGSETDHGTHGSSAFVWMLVRLKTLADAARGF